MRSWVNLQMDEVNARHAIGVKRGREIELGAEVNTGDVEDRISTGHGRESLGASSRRLGHRILTSALPWMGQA
jgi:hypothetical protein